MLLLLLTLSCCFFGVNEENILSEKVSRISPWHYRNDPLWTLFDYCVKTNNTCSRRSLPLMKKGKTQNGEVTPVKHHRLNTHARRKHIFQLLPFFMSFFCTFTLEFKHTEGAVVAPKGSDTTELHLEPWKSEEDKRVQNACKGGSCLPLMRLKSEIRVRRSICELWQTGMNYTLGVNVISTKSVSGC